MKYNLDSNSLDYKLIREGQTEKILLINNANITSFFIEKISGDFTISTNSSNVNVSNYSNFYFFDIFFKQSNSFNIYLNITAKKNSVYTFKTPKIDSKYIENNKLVPYILHNDGNYIFKLNETDIILNTTEYFTKDLYKLINIFSPNCKISVKYLTINGNNYYYEKADLKYDFFQEILTSINKDQLLDIHLEKNKSDQCYLFVSNYNISSDNNHINYSIILDENFPQLFSFNEKRYLLKFTFCQGFKNEGISITFNLLNSAKYEITIFVQGISKKTISNLHSNKTINLGEDYWKNICSAQEKCNISFTVLSIVPTKESYLQIIINDKEEKKNKRSVWIIIILIISIIIVGLLSFLIFIRIVRKKRSLNVEIKSLQTERDMPLTN